jgi:hypothetical protein
MNRADKERGAKYSSLHPPTAKQAPQELSASISDTTSAVISSNVEEASRKNKEAVSSQPIASFTVIEDKKVSDEAAASAFGNFKDLGDSLFTEGSKTSVKSDFGFSGTSSVVGDVAGVKPEPDYHAILTEFYKTHNPAKLIEVDRTLEKYKVSSRWFCSCV